MDEFLNDDQLRRLFERNLPKQQPSPEMVERLVRRVQAEVRANYGVEQRTQPVLRQLAQRRTGNSNSSVANTQPSSEVFVPRTIAKETGRRWLFSSVSTTWVSFVGTVAAILLLAVIVTRPQIRDAVQTMAGGAIKPGQVQEVAVQQSTPTEESIAQISGTSTPESGQLAEQVETPTESSAQITDATPTTENDNLSVEPTNTPSERGKVNVLGSATPTPVTPFGGGNVTSVPTINLSTVNAPLVQTVVTKQPIIATATKSGAERNTPTRTPVRTATSVANPVFGVIATKTKTPTGVRTPTSPPTVRPGATNTSSNLPLPTSTPTTVIIIVAEPKPTQTRFVQPTPTRTKVTLAPAVATSTATVTIRPVNTPVPSSTATSTTTPRLTTSPTSTPSRTPTRTATSTSTRTATNTPSPTQTPVPTSTATNTPSPVPTNSAPQVGAVFFSVDEDVSESLNVLFFASDADNDPLMLVAVTAPANGTALIEGGRVVYSPRANYNGADQFSFTISDGQVQVTAIAQIAVQPVNDPPIARALSADVAEDESVSVSPLDSAIDVENNRIEVVSVSKPAHGTASINGTSVTYQPDPGFTGADIFSYRISDGSEQAEATITVNVYNRSPEAVNDIASTYEDQPVSIGVLANDSDSPNDRLTIIGFGGAANGVLTLDGANLVYTPNPNYSGIDVFQYTISDGEKIASASVQVTVTAVNDAPTGTVASITVTENGEVTFDPFAGISDIEGNPLTVQSISQPDHGSAELDNERIRYRPAANYYGKDQIKYVVTDGAAALNVTVDVTVEFVNVPPTASDATATVDKNSSVAIDLLGRVNDANGDPLTLSVVTQPANGDVSVSGWVVTYSPNPAYTGSDSFVYRVSDGHDTATATVLILVVKQNEDGTPADPTPESQPTAADPNATPTREGGDSAGEAAGVNAEPEGTEPVNGDNPPSQP